MATTYKILGQITGSATSSLQTLYTVPGATQAVVSSLVVVNQSTLTQPYRLSVVPSGSATSTKTFLAFDIQITGSDSTALTLGLTLGAGDFIQVAGVQTGSFSVFGSEIS